MSNKPYLLALNRIAQLGPVKILKLLTFWPNLADLFSFAEVSDITALGISQSSALAIKRFNFEEIEEDLKWEQPSSCRIITWEETEYPALLREIHAPPLIIYAKGNLDCLNLPSLAVVGTRKPSVQAKNTAKRFCYQLANQLVIVSGLALGIDAEAHQGALEANGKTIAVLGTGIEVIYPREHRYLAEKFLPDNLMLSEFPLKSPPNARHFPQRNRIISGLSLATLVIEAAIRSGSLITARYALEQNRDVLAVPGSIYNFKAQGCHYLLQQGAQLVTSAEEILQSLKFANPLKSSVFVINDPPEQGFLSYLSSETVSIDQLVMQSNLSIDEVLMQVTQFEIEGKIQSVPGGYIKVLS